MNGTTWSWLLGGALVASLAWNAAALRGDATAAPACGASSCAAAIDRIGELELTGAQRAELESLLRRCEEASTAADERARRLAREIAALLREPGADAASIRSLGRELATLRADAVLDCIASSLALRDLLGPERTGRVLDGCCGDGCAAGG